MSNRVEDVRKLTKWRYEVTSRTYAIPSLAHLRPCVTRANIRSPSRPTRVSVPEPEQCPAPKCPSPD